MTCRFQNNATKNEWVCWYLLDTDVSVYADESGDAQASGADGVATVGVDDLGVDPLQHKSVGC